MSDTFKKFTRTIEVNGVSVEAAVTITVTEDYDISTEGDYDNGSAEEIEAYRQRFYSGELFMGQVLVEASAFGEFGADCLGACHLFSNNYFDSKPYEDSVNAMIEDHKMIETAIEELTKALTIKAEELKPFAL